MQRIKDFGLRVKLEKCKFALNQIDYLGAIINKNGIQPNQERVLAIKQMSEPTNVTELK